MSSNLGHRQRLITKFLEAPEVFSDVDLLELLLFFTITRKNTKPIALKILHTKQSLKNVLAESNKIPGITKNTKAFLKLIYVLLLQISMPSTTSMRYLTSKLELIRFFQQKMDWKTNEELHCVFLNSRHQITNMEVINVGNTNRIYFDKRHLIGRCIDYATKSIILVHNHPSGDPSPSYEDIELTKETAALLKGIQIILEDHIIIGKTNYFSFAEKNLL